MSQGRLDWDRDGGGWPNREHSRFVTAGGMRWHVQVMGAGPAMLLLHGTGAATHSWRDLAPLLARHFTVIAPDLPGHGFSDMPPPRGLSLAGMAEGIQALLATLGHDPAIAVGHSAGAAILLRLAIDGGIHPRLLIGLNAALLPLRGGAAQLFSPVAKLLAGLPVVPRLFAASAAADRTVERLLRDTGSTPTPEAVALYGLLVRNPGHVAGALGMMANWDLRQLMADLPRLRVPLLLIAGRRDRTIPPADTLRVRALAPAARSILLPGLGHLAHEEKPNEIAALILAEAMAETARQ